jgi:putative tricarboxylic transport membrane protein
VPGVDGPTLKEAGIDLAVQNWRMVAAAPGHHRRAEGRHHCRRGKAWRTSAGWKTALETKGWVDTYLAGAAFDAQLAADIAATETILKDIGLVQ